MTYIKRFIILLLVLILSGCTVLNTPSPVQYQVTFQTLNGDTPYVQTIESFLDHDFNEEAIPLYPGYIFAGWYLDPTYMHPYEAFMNLERDVQLFAHWVTLLDADYEIIGDILSWVVYPDIKNYRVEIGPTLIYELDPSIHSMDLSTLYESLLEETKIVIYIVFQNDRVHPIIDLFVYYDVLNTIYETGFEEEVFPSQTSYNNNVNPKILGYEGFKWSIINGAVSTTNAIKDTKSIQLRVYDNTTNTPHAKTDFLMENVSEIKFLGASGNHHVRVQILSETHEVLQDELFTLTTSAKEFTLKIETDVPFYTKFLLEKVSATPGLPIFIDDVKYMSKTSEIILKEVIKSEQPSLDEAELNAIKERFEKDRVKLVPPFYPLLSNEGLLDYYSDLNGLTGQAFKSKLEAILKTTHRRLISYAEARFVLELSDQIKVGQETYLDGIYSNHSIVPYWDGGTTWAREHVWPNSRLGIPRVTSSSKNQGSDVHNLRAINPSVNSSRSNRYFLEASSFGLVGTEAYYPGDSYKGDVARILLYMIARYPDILSLRDENIIDSAYTLEGAVMGHLTTLLKWHEEDPVSAFEIKRNEVIYTFQGNRNPFIDYPEFANVYFN